MNKKESLSVSMPKLIMSVTLIVMLGAFLGILYYFAANISKPSPSVTIVPVGWLHTKKDVVIITDKTEYELGETIKITVKNNSDKSIWYFSNSYLSLQLLGYQNNNWIKVPMLPSTPLLSGYIPEISELKTGNSIILEYEPEAMIDKSYLKYSKYIISFKIKEIKKYDLTLVYSNEFTIKEKLDVSITTDKAEYEQGETVKIIISHSDKPIYVEFPGFGGAVYTFYQLKGEVWEKLTTACETNCIMTCENGILKQSPCILYEQPQYNFYEYKGLWETQWNQKQCVYENKLCGGKNYSEGLLKEAPAGKFKVEFCYFDKEDVDLSAPPGDAMSDKKKCVEKEFTIKEKSALDPRCGQKVKITGLCEGKLIDDIGYQFNSEIGKCIERAMGGTGCRVESPFTSLEECQMTCEILKAKELSFETIENVNWPGIGEKKNYVIKNKEEWQDVWAEAGHSAIAPIVDFNKEMVVAVFYGVAPTGGYNIEIIKIIESADKLEVFVKETSPGEGCIVTQATTEPRHIIKLQKSDKEIIFNVTRITTNCGAYGH